MRKLFVLSALLIFFTITCLSQNRTVITDKEDQTADQSAILDVISTDRGFLLPRIDGNDKVNDPAESLLIYNKETHCVETFLDGGWHEIWCAEIEPHDCGTPFSYDGYDYATVEIGDQCWFAENSKYLPSVSGASSGSKTDPIYYVWGYNGTDVEEAKLHTEGGTNMYDTYGVLYNWPAAMTACPFGWRLPTDDDWKELELFYGMCPGTGDDPKCVEDTDYRGTNQAAMIAGSDLWWGGDLTDDPEFDENSDFNGLPAGTRQTDNQFTQIGMITQWWSSTEHDTDIDRAWYRYFIWLYPTIARNTFNRDAGFSVRCIEGL